MSATDQTANDVFNTLTGFDEIAIKREFKADVLTLAKTDKAGFLRALVFIDHRRAGVKDRDAFKATMELLLSEVTDYFADEPADDDAEAEGDDSGEA